MKTLLKIVLLSLLCTSAYALNLNLVINEIKPNLYESISGIVIKTEGCNAPDSTAIELNYEENNGEGRIIYASNEPVIVDGEIEYADIEIICAVEWVGGLRDLGATSLPDTASNAVYDADSGSLHLYNIELWERLTDTGQRFKYARLNNIDGAFVLEELTQ